MEKNGIGWCHFGDYSNYVFSMLMIWSMIRSITSLFTCPAGYWIIRLSAVNNRFGLTLLSCRSVPEEKSFSRIVIAYWSDTLRLVICERITSSPLSAAIMRAGRFFALLKSEKGNRTTTTSPFTNLPTPHPPRGVASLLRGKIRLQ